VTTHGTTHGTTPGTAPGTAPVAGAVRRYPRWVLSILVLAGTIYLGLFALAALGANFEVLHALTVVPVLFAITVPIAVRIGRRDGDPTLVAIVLAAFAAKLLMAYVRYQIAYSLEGGRTDATVYDLVGRALAPQIRQFDFDIETGRFIGTGFVNFLTGLVYAVFGSGRMVGFVVFAWISFLGFVLLTRAFRVGIPDGDSRRYTIAVLFLPSLLFWPAIIGKEAWMMLGIGLASYGIAVLFRGRSVGVLPFAAGIGAMLLVRPHMALLVVAATLVAVVVRRAPGRTFATPIIRILTVSVALLIGVFIASQTASFFERTAAIEGGSINAALSQTAEKSAEETTEAGSAFSPVTVNSPLDMGPAFVTVLFRPFPFEVGDPTGLAAAAEGMFLVGLLIVSRNRLRSIPRLVRTTPYLTYALTYLVVFVFAFSSFANFGILARQRVQAMPFLLVLIALPRFRDLVLRSDAVAADATPTPAPATPATPATRPTGPAGRRRARRRPVPTGAGPAPRRVVPPSPPTA
jgi:hypothetical protein